MNKLYTIEEIRKIAVPIAQQYGVEKLALFGSYAKGQAKEGSDLDFIIEKGKIRGLEFYGFINALEDAFALKVDMMTYQSMPKSIFFGPIEEIVLYEQCESRVEITTL